MVEIVKEINAVATHTKSPRVTVINNAKTTRSLRVALISSALAPIAFTLGASSLFINAAFAAPTAQQSVQSAQSTAVEDDSVLNVITTAIGKSVNRAGSTIRDVGAKAKDTAAEISTYALSLIGVNYRFGGNTPEQGLDCSGLIRYVFLQATGINLPRTAAEQARVGKPVSIDNLQPGDLVFFNTRHIQFSHAGIYIGDNRFVHAPSTGKSVQVVSFEKQYWQNTFNGARRVIESIPQITSAVVPTAYAAAPSAPTAPSLAITPSGQK